MNFELTWDDKIGKSHASGGACGELEELALERSEPPLSQSESTNEIMPLAEGKPNVRRAP
jgi:hypothetical protein